MRLKEGYKQYTIMELGHLKLQQERRWIETLQLITGCKTSKTSMLNIAFHLDFHLGVRF